MPAHAAIHRSSHTDILFLLLSGNNPNAQRLTNIQPKCDTCRVKLFYYSAIKLNEALTQAMTQDEPGKDAAK